MTLPAEQVPLLPDDAVAGVEEIFVIKCPRRDAAAHAKEEPCEETTSLVWFIRLPMPSTRAEITHQSQMQRMIPPAFEHNEPPSSRQRGATNLEDGGLSVKYNNLGQHLRSRAASSGRPTTPARRQAPRSLPLPVLPAARNMRFGRDCHYGM